MYCTQKLISARNRIFKIPKRNGYVVLVPEIGEESPKKNPLLKNDEFPEFNSITIERCIAAIGKQAIEFEEKIKYLGESINGKKNIDIFKNVLEPIEKAYAPLDTTWGVAKTLYSGNLSLMPTKVYYNIHNHAQRALANKYNNEAIFNACKNALNDNSLNINNTQRRVLTKYILEGKLNGLELSEKNKNDLYHCVGQMGKKTKEFREKLETSTKMFNHTLRDPQVARDFPPNLMKATAANSKKPHEGPWIITLQPNIYATFLEYCSDRALRYKIWEAYVTRASFFQERVLQNSSPIQDIRHYRNSQAKLLGYKNYAEMSMDTKMAGSVDNVHLFLDKLLEPAYIAQEKEIETLSEFARERGFNDTIQSWDIAYWSRKQYYSTFKFQEDQLKSFFPLQKVLSGMFKLIERLFNVHIVESNKAVGWHQDVRFYEVFDKNKSDSAPVGYFYLDPYSTEENADCLFDSYGFTVPIKHKSKICDSKPLSVLIFNFSPPKPNQPSLLSFNDVITLFQKFGHVLQHLLTEVDYSEVGGTSFIEWDTVFIADKFLANWIYEPSVLEEISGHYDTNEPLSEEAIKALIGVKTHLAGYKLCRELYLSKMDLELHEKNQFWTDIMKRLWPKYFVVPQHKKNSHVCSFSQIFVDNWGAGYYSHIWSEMIAADLYSAFQEIPGQDKNKQQEIGKRFRETYLALGGSYPGSEIFRKFRGRDPSHVALLTNLNLTNIESK